MTNNYERLEQLLDLTNEISQIMAFLIKDLFSRCDQIRRKLRIWSHLLKKYFMKIIFFLCSAIVTLISIIFS